MKFLAVLFLTLALASCGLHAPDHWDKSFNPLDTPGYPGLVPPRVGGPNWMRQF